MGNPIPSYRSLRDIEYKINSKNGEDGIIDFMVSCLPLRTNTFLEIGCGTGKECNTTNLAKRFWTGYVFDEKPTRVEKYKKMGFPIAAYGLRLTPLNINLILERATLTPDLFSLGIRSYDYWLMKALLEEGFSPSICVLQYNQYRSDSLAYPPDLKRDKGVDWGCGINMWQKLLNDYTFVTVDSSKSNGFFIRGMAPQSITEIQWCTVSAG